MMYYIDTKGRTLQGENHMNKKLLQEITAELVKTSKAKTHSEQTLKIDEFVKFFQGKMVGITTTMDLLGYRWNGKEFIKVDIENLIK